MNKQRRKKYKKAKTKSKNTGPLKNSEKIGKKNITLLNVLLIVAFLVFIGNTIYQLLHWREAFDQFRQLGLFGSLGLIAVVFIVRKWIDSL